MGSTEEKTNTVMGKRDFVKSILVAGAVVTWSRCIVQDTIDFTERLTVQNFHKNGKLG